MTVPCAEDPVVTVTLSHPVADVVIGQECVSSGYWWNALTAPPFAMRYEYAPPSQFLPGQQLLSAVPDASALAAGLIVADLSQAALEARRDVLTGVLTQWRFTVTIDADGVIIGQWNAQPAIPVWGDITPQGLGLLALPCTVSIPVNPVGAP